MQENPRLASCYMDILFNQGEVIEDSLGTLVQGGCSAGMFAVPWCCSCSCGVFG
jgi:hypothetical protein